MKAKDIMTLAPRVVAADQPVSAAAGLMKRLDVGMIPVVENLESRRLSGVITDRDITIRHVAEGHTADCPVRAHMTAAPLVIAHEDEDIHDVLARMEEHRVRRAPVTDEGVAVVGVISGADIALRLGAIEPMEVERFFEAVSRPELIGA
jgi:CBS domain-containing protein